jgi:hypothetical protein
LAVILAFPSGRHHDTVVGQGVADPALHHGENVDGDLRRRGAEGLEDGGSKALLKLFQVTVAWSHGLMIRWTVPVTTPSLVWLKVRPALRTVASEGMALEIEAEEPIAHAPAGRSRSRRRR